MMTKPFPKIALTLCAFALTACNSLMENQSGHDYETKNQDGETVYRRVTPVASPPIAMPTPPRYSEEPLPIAPISIQSSAEDSRSTKLMPASEKDKGEPFFGNVDLALSTVEGRGNFHTGVHVGMNVSDWFSPRIGVSLFVSKDVYTGFDLSSRFNLPVGKLKPFLGIGVYAGDTKECGYQIDPYSGRYEEVCDKKFLTAGYAELGIEIDSVSLFVRDYRLTRAGLSIPTNLFWGIGLRF